MLDQAPNTENRKVNAGKGTDPAPAKPSIAASAEPTAQTPPATEAPPQSHPASKTGPKNASTSSNGLDRGPGSALSTSDSPICRARGLAKQVIGPTGPLDILNAVDLDVAPGEAVAIIGASGSGKSTLLGLLAGLDRASSGSVALCGSALEPLDEDARAALRAGRVGFVFQSFQLIPTLTALENVLLPLELASGLNAGSAKRTAEAALERVGLSERRGHYPRQLSGGEQQRVAIARAFAPGPEVLFADEPTGNLDEATGARIIDLLFGLREDAGAALVLVTHDPALARRCDRRLSMSGGRLEVTA